MAGWPHETRNTRGLEKGSAEKDKSYPGDAAAQERYPMAVLLDGCGLDALGKRRSASGDAGKAQRTEGRAVAKAERRC